MIKPLEYVKSYDQKRKQKRLVHSQKILKNRIKSLLPNDATLKLFYNQNGKNVNESSLLKFYKFNQISRYEYQKILSNPLYFLQNDRNVRMFKHYLIKNNLLDKIEGKISKQQMKRKKSIMIDDQALMQYQFIDKSKVNYQQPWNYIDQTIKKMEKQTKSQISKVLNSSVTNRHISLMNTKKLNNLSSISITKSRQLQQSQGKEKSIKKSMSLSYLTKLKQRENKINLIKSNLLSKQIQTQNTSRINYFNKLLQSQIRIQKKLQKQALLRSQNKLRISAKFQNYKDKRQKSQSKYSQMKQYNQKLRKICINTVYTRSKSAVALDNVSAGKQVHIQNINSRIKLKETKSKIRKQNMIKMLQKRLGIQEQFRQSGDNNPQITKKPNK